VRFLLVLLILICCTNESRAVSDSLPTIPLRGIRYVSLKKWAAANHFTLNWEPRAETATVSSKWATLTFTINSKRATINGTMVSLSIPVIAHADAVFIGEKDIVTLLNPILFPPKLPKGKKIRVIAIAPGHGGKDPGYMFNNQQEKKYTLLLAKEIQNALAPAGIKVIMTRDTDEFVSLEDQAARANRARADLFITVHYNAAREIDAKGVETYCLTPEGATSTNGGPPRERAPGNKTNPFNILLAYEIQKSILREMEMADRGVKRAAFVVLREIHMPGVLIEGGFMTNPSDARKIFDPANRRKMAAAIVDAILEYKRLVER
jgi:N-acetylmuramoyl-L-alanine amidase